MLTWRLKQLIKHWVGFACHRISTFVCSFHSHFMFFKEKHLTNFWEWTFSSLRTSNCFTISELSLYAMVLYWTESLSIQYRLKQYICHVHHLDACCTEPYEGFTSTITRKRCRIHYLLLFQFHFHIYFYLLRWAHNLK